MAEGILNGKKEPQFTAHSAEVFLGKVRPEALKQLELGELADGRSASKSWNEFARPGGPVMNFVFTVAKRGERDLSDLARSADDRPLGVADPAAVKGSPQEVERAFREAFNILSRRMNLFLSLPVERLDGPEIKKELDSIGNGDTPATAAAKNQFQ